MTESGSSIGTYQACNRLYLYKYEKLLETTGYSSSLGVGSFVHAFIESFSGVGRKNAPALELEAQKQRAAVEFHAQIESDYILAKRMADIWRIRWENGSGSFVNSAFTWLDSEAEWSFKVGEINHVGKRDGLLLHKAWNKTFLYELKTASALGAETYFNRLEMDRQISSNILALRQAGIPCDGVVMDLVFKPALRLLTGRKTKPDETIAEFHDRIIEAMANDRDKYFQRQIIYRTDQQLENHLSDLHHVLSQMKTSREAKAWPRNTGACDDFGRLCPYFACCLGNSAEADLELMFRRRTKKLPELSEATNASEG